MNVAVEIQAPPPWASVPLTGQQRLMDWPLGAGRAVCSAEMGRRHARQVQGLIALPPQLLAGGPVPHFRERDVRLRRG